MVSAVNLTAGATNASGFVLNTVTISPSANKLILVTVASKINATNPNEPSLSGCSMTWVKVATIIKTDNQRIRLTMFRAMSATPTSGVLSFDFGGQSQEETTWMVDEISGMRASGVNGDNTIVQVATSQAGAGGTATTTGLTITLGAFADVLNATYGSVCIIDGAITPGSGFSELAEADSPETNQDSIFKNSNDTSVDWTWSAGYGVGVAVEIAAELNSPSSSQSPSASASPSSSLSPSGSSSESSSISHSPSPSASLSPSSTPSSSPSSSISPSDEPGSGLFSKEAIEGTLPIRSKNTLANIYTQTEEEVVELHDGDMVDISS